MIFFSLNSREGFFPVLTSTEKLSENSSVVMSDRYECRECMKGYIINKRYRDCFERHALCVRRVLAPT